METYFFEINLAVFLPIHCPLSQPSLGILSDFLEAKNRVLEESKMQMNVKPTASSESGTAEGEN